MQLLALLQARRLAHSARVLVAVTTNDPLGTSMGTQIVVQDACAYSPFLPSSLQYVPLQYVPLVRVNTPEVVVLLRLSC